MVYFKLRSKFCVLKITEGMCSVPGGCVVAVRCYTNVAMLFAAVLTKRLSQGRHSKSRLQAIFFQAGMQPLSLFALILSLECWFT